MKGVLATLQQNVNIMESTFDRVVEEMKSTVV
jgi:hypothetical protein